MAGRVLALAAAFATLGESILLPPSAAADTIDTDSELSTWTVVDPFSQPLLVPCQGCQSVNPSLLLNISVESDAVEIGGNPIFPMRDVMKAGIHNPPYAVEVPSELSLADVRATINEYPTVEITGWTFISHNTQSISDAGDEIIDISLQISSIDRIRVTVPSIRIKLLKNPEAKLMILGASYEEAPEGAVSDQPACDSLICRWRHRIEENINQIAHKAHEMGGNRKPCGAGKGMMGHHGHAFPTTNMHHGPGSHHSRPLGEHGRPHPFGWAHHKHHGHHRHMKFHRILRRVGRFIVFVAFPILVGVSAGIAAYTIGMWVGCAVTMAWVKFRHGNRSGYGAVALDEDEAVAKDLEIDAEGRESFESAPPVYEDAPVYEEKEVA